METGKILIIEDSRITSTFLVEILSQAGYQALPALSGEEGLKLFAEQNPDVVLLDIHLPGIDGWDVCRRIRQQSYVPIIMVSAEHDTVIDKVKGLDLGANDYMVKPFDRAELLARVRANLRISSKLMQTNSYRDDFLSIDILERRVVRDGEEVVLTEKEFALLTVLLRFASSSVSSQTLFAKVWGYPDLFDPNYVRIYMSSLRKKIEPNPKKPKYIQTERGIGYRFKLQN